MAGRPGDVKVGNTISSIGDYTPVRPEEILYKDSNVAAELERLAASAGNTGSTWYTATVDIKSGAAVNKTDIRNPDGIKVKDMILDSNGDYYTVTAVAEDTVTVGDALGSLKGRDGQDGATPTINVATNADIDGVFED